MANCCNNSLNKVFCNAFNKYYNTLYINGEISKRETDNLLIISYIRKLLLNPSYEDYTKILLKALRCIADRSCLLDSSWLYNRSTVPTITNKYISTSSREASAETDPIFRASPAYNITNEDIENWNNAGGGALVVTLTLDGTFSADYTYTEILEAWNNKQDVILIYANSEYQFSYTDNVEGGSIYFSRTDNYGGPFLDYFELDGTDDSWHQYIVNLQQKLVSGTNIKTINSSSILGGGNIDLLTTNFCPIIEDTRSSSVATITGVAPFSELVDGQRIVLHLNYNTANNATLTLTLRGGSTTNAIPLYYRRYNGFVDTIQTTFGIYLAGQYVEMFYNSSSNIWLCVSDHDTNTTYPVISQNMINAGVDTSNRVIPAKLLHDNAYIVEESYSSGSLKANKMYDFGTVSTALTIPSLDVTNDLVNNALNFYALRFISGTDNLSITYPTGVQKDAEPTINTGDYVEIMINKYGNNFYASIKVWPAQ